jgi:phenylacetate-CoA ligase
MTQDFFAPIVRNILFPAWVWKNRSSLLRELRQMEQIQYAPATTLRQLQAERLVALVGHAYATCPFYRRKFDMAGVSPADIRSLDDTARLPITTKAEIQQCREDMISSAYRGRPLLRDMTGGSTGSPLVFHYDTVRRASRNAAVIRHNRWAGWDIGDRVALLWGAPRDAAKGLKARLRARLLDRSVFLDASSIDSERMASFANFLAAEKPKVILGYANTLALFARFLLERRLNGIRPATVVSSAEVLTEDHRMSIERALGCRVFNRYGCREFGVIASECEYHSGMHINADNLLVEVVAANRSVLDTEGEILITDLRNLAMPMIRYRIMDRGILHSAPCPCGRGLPLLAVPGGRVTDFLLTPQGTRVSGVVMATYVITNIPGIQQIQFVQERQNSVTVRLVRGPEWNDAALAALTTKIHGFLGETIEVDTVFVDHIPQEPSGKYRFSIGLP